MRYNGWEYIGDESIRHGGMYWRTDEGDPVASVLQVVRLADGGAPDNLFRILIGTVDLERETLADAREVAGLPEDGGDVGMDVEALLSYEGMGDYEYDYVVRIGPHDALFAGPGEFPEPDRVLRAGTSLRKWLQREHLHKEPAETAAISRSM